MLALLFPSFVSFTVRIFAWQGLLGSDGPIKALTGRALLYTPAVLIGMVATYRPAMFVLPAYVAVARCRAQCAGCRLGPRRPAVPANHVGDAANHNARRADRAVVVGVLSLGEFVGLPRCWAGARCCCSR